MLRLQSTRSSCYSPEEGGVDLRELGITSPKLVEEIAPNLLKKSKDKVKKLT